MFSLKTNMLQKICELYSAMKQERGMCCFKTKLVQRIKKPVGSQGMC